MRQAVADPTRIDDPYGLIDFDHESWRQEIERLRHLPDPFLGGTLLRLVRQVRADHPELVGPQDRPTNFGSLFWYALPDLARRLGAPGLWTTEGNPWLCSLDAREFREKLCAAMRAQTYFSQTGRRSPALWRCVAPPGRGNIVVLALDRVAAPDPRPEAGDYAAEMVRRTATHRGIVTGARAATDIVSAVPALF